MSDDQEGKTISIPARRLRHWEVEECEHPGAHPWMKPRAEWWIDWADVPDELEMPKSALLCDSCFEEFCTNFTTGAVLFWDSNAS